MNTNKTTTSALEELSADFGISETECGGKVKTEGKDAVVASRRRLGESTGAPENQRGNRRERK